jgi:hypothetical protein
VIIGYNGTNCNREACTEKEGVAQLPFWPQTFSFTPEELFAVKELDRCDGFLNASCDKKLFCEKYAL